MKSDKKPVVVIEIESERKPKRRRDSWERSMDVHIRRLKKEDPTKIVAKTDGYTKKFQEGIQKLRGRISNFRLIRGQRNMENYVEEFQEDIKKIREKIYNQ